MQLFWPKVKLILQASLLSEIWIHFVNHLSTMYVLRWLNCVRLHKNLITYNCAKMIAWNTNMQGWFHFSKEVRLVSQLHVTYLSENLFRWISGWAWGNVNHLRLACVTPQKRKPMVPLPQKHKSKGRGSNAGFLSRAKKYHKSGDFPRSLGAPNI